MDHLPPIPSNISTIAAPLLLGALWNWCLYGVFAVQLYIYFSNFPNDGIRTKCLVYGVFLLETIQTAMSAADVYYWFIAGYGNMIHLGNVYISPFDTPLLCGAIAAIVQCFFAYRIFKLDRSLLWLCGIIVITSMAQVAGAIGSCIQGQALGEFQKLHLNKVLTYTWLIGDALSDVLIAGTMLLLFYKVRKVGFYVSSNIMAKLVRLVVETNVLTAGFALLALILYATLPERNYFVCPTLIIGKLYSNTVLVTFNNRIALRNTVVTDESPKTVWNTHSLSTGGSRSTTSNAFQIDHFARSDLSRSIELPRATTSMKTRDGSDATMA